MPGGAKTAVKTNTTPNSVCKVGVEPIKFEAIWNGYPDGHPSQAKDAKGNLLYENQCAIKVSVALHKAGVEMKSFGQAATTIDGKRAALAAQHLANWLDKMPFCGLPQKAEIVTGADWEKKIKRRSGIIFFADYCYSTEAAAKGDQSAARLHPHQRLRRATPSRCARRRELAASTKWKMTFRLRREGSVPHRRNSVAAPAQWRPAIGISSCALCSWRLIGPAPRPVCTSA